VGGRLGMVGAAGAGVGYAAEVLADNDTWKSITENARFPEAAEKIYEGVQLVHGSPRDPVAEYVWPGHGSYFLPYNAQLDMRLAEILAARQTLHCLCGHTHVPAALVQYGSRELFRGQGWNRMHTFVGPQTMFWVPDGEAVLEGLSEHPAILNPGSVGQPRDGRPEASYAVYDGDTWRLRRVGYDIARAQERIRALPIAAEASEYLAERIARGE
jgi:diadenosine tetraphosphatase ApaH/serine/threonine PP2A family protein phosphatase